MKNRFCILIAAVLLMLTGTACAVSLPADLQTIEESAFEGDQSLHGVATLPDGVISVGSRAFAATGLHALVLPEGCGSMAADALADGQAAYVTILDAETAISGDALEDVPFVFGPADGSASALPGFWALESRTDAAGFYFSVTEEEAIPLCAVDGAALSGTVTLPKFVNGLPVRSLDTLDLIGCDDVTTLRVPSYLTLPDGLSAETYAAMTLTAPVADVTESEAGNPITWTTSVDGAYGDVAYIWTITVGGVTKSVITAVPTVVFTPETDGACTVTVTAVDALDDRVTASGAAITVTPAVPIYRALLVGQLYEGQETALDGCDTDVAAMRTILNSMTGTDYAVSSYIDLTASGITSAISSTFADARVCDVSLFYYSGHGTDSGSLVGTGNSTITVSNLRALLDTIPGTKIVIIDACYSGNMIGKSVGASDPSAFTSAFISGFSSYTKDNLATNGYIVMTASSKNQRSQTLSDGTISFGAFTYGLCYGSGYDEWYQTALGSLPADADGNGAITLSEAYTKAVERVDWLKTMVSMEQVAQYYGDDAFVLWSK